MLGRVFLSDSHLGTVWSSLYDEGLLENLSTTQCQTVKAEMYTVAKQLLSQFPTYGLTQLSKELVNRAIPFISNLRTPPETNTFTAKEPRFSTDIKELPSIDVTASSHKQRNRQVFDDDLQRRRQDFESMVAVKIPDPPKFADDTDEKNTDISSLLAALEEDRKMQITGL